MTLAQLLQLTIDRNASDLHLIIGAQPLVRVNGDLQVVIGSQQLTKDEIESLIFPILNESQAKILKEEWELDFGMEFENRARFRVNIYKQRGGWAGSFRVIPLKIRPLEEIGLPKVLTKITELKQGLILVTGPTGHGKSTTLAAFTNHINLSRNTHIITVEDPIEFKYPPGRSIISQREINSDTKSWGNALKSALREDPDVVLIGEMRDLETISAALTIAETGHLVFATLHTNSAAQSIDRIIDVFPSTQQPQIRVQLAAILECIISQRLVPTINPGRALAAEVLFANSATRALIRDNKSFLIDNLIQTSAELGMVSMENSLVYLVKQGIISLETALNYTTKPQVLTKLLGGTFTLNN